MWFQDEARGGQHGTLPRLWAAHAVLVLDGAGWHGSKALRVPDNLTLQPLPPCAPDLNPIENLRACPHANRRAMLRVRNPMQIRSVLIEQTPHPIKSGRMVTISGKNHRIASPNTWISTKGNTPR